MAENLKNEDRWTVADSYMKVHPLLRNQIDSFNNFINKSVYFIYKSKRICVERNECICTYEFNDVIVHEPVEIKEISTFVPMFPKRCIANKSTYSANVTADIVMTLQIGDSKPIVREFNKVNVISLPVMVLSDKCNLKKIFNYKKKVASHREDIYDTGGYFIIKGNKKFLVCQEKQLPNKVLIFKDKKKGIIYAEIKSTCTEKFHSKTIKVIYTVKNKSLGVSIPYIDSTTIPIGIVFKALGALDNNIIRKLVNYENEEALLILEKSLEATIHCESAEQALSYIGKKGRKYEKDNVDEIQDSDEDISDEENKNAETAVSTKHSLENELFPHLGADFNLKKIFLGRAVSTLLKVVCGERECDDRDHFCNKVLINVDELLSTQLSSVVTAQIKKTERIIIQSLTSGASSLLAGHKIDAKKSTDNFLAALNTNRWFGRINAQGICQNSDQYNSWGSISNMRKMTTAINEEGTKIILPRRLHPSQWGICCKYGTPEGKRCIFKSTVIETPFGPVKIKDLKNGDTVYTVNPQTYAVEKSKIYDYFTTKKELFEVITIGGWKIKATGDHPFLTNSGWKELSDIEQDDKLFVVNNINSAKHGGTHKIILSDLSSVVDVNPSVLKKHEHVLREMNILPLYDDSNILPVLARIVGYTFADAGVYLANGIAQWRGSFGQEKDCEEFENDVEYLGFKRKSGIFRESEFLMGDRMVKHKTYGITHHGSFCTLLLALGTGCGRKTHRPTYLPLWIKNGSALVKREYLGGLLGGDGGSAFYSKRQNKKNAYSFTFGDFVQHKWKHVESLEIYMKDIRLMLKEFGVDTSVPEIRKEKYGSYKVLLRFSNSMESIISYGDNIGYRYCDTKRKRTERIWFYMRYKRDIWTQRIELKKEINLRHSNGESPSKLAKEKNLTSRQLFSLIEQKDTETLAPRNILNPDDFLVDYNGTGCFVKIKSVKNVGVDIVADFTTKSENHSFIANGFVTHNCGFIKHLALNAIITKEDNAKDVIEHIRTIDEVEKLSEIVNADEVLVSVNYVPIGVTTFPKKVLQEIINIRRFRHCRELSVKYEDDEISVLCLPGRLQRGLFIVEKGKALISRYRTALREGKIGWNDLLEMGYVEYIDKHEEDSCITALAFEELKEMKDFTHCEIHPSFTIGVDASVIPFPNRNLSPRLIYQSNMGKQAFSIPGMDYLFSSKGKIHVLNYPGKQLCYTKSAKLIGYDKMPTGYPARIAICPYRGLNQEDAIVINRASVDRGFMCSTAYITFETTIKGEEVLEIPSAEDCNNIKGDFSKIGKSGIINFKTTIVRKNFKGEEEVRKINTKVKQGDVLIAKTCVLGEKLRKSKQNLSVLYDKDLDGTVHSIDRGFDSDGYEYVKVTISVYERPEEGDKFTSLISQKGVCGFIAPPEDLPTMIDGSCPDIIINPLSQPSRLTLGMLLEILLTKCLCINTQKLAGTSYEQSYSEDVSGDATPYDKTTDLKTIMKYLKKTGNSGYGEDFMYDGITGEPLNALIFNGVCYYQRLKHLVRDKVHVRTRGPKSVLYNQPTEGRRLKGGLRVGEMERDCSVKGTPITLSNGLAVPIETLNECNSYVLGWDKEKDGLIRVKQSNFIYKGKKECFELTLEDGRKIGYTKNHPLLTSENEWIKVKDLMVEETCVKVGVTPPPVNHQVDMELCEEWKLKVGEYTFKTDTMKHYLKTTAFARILGLVITDGHVYQDSIGIRTFFGHKLDVDAFCEDVQFICGLNINKNYKMTKNTYYLELPPKLSQGIKSLKGILYGAKVNQEACLPEFITDENCPVPIVREFLGGLFGGDGHACQLSLHRGKRDLLSSVSFSKTKAYGHIKSLQGMMRDLCALLSKCGVTKTTIQKPKETTNSKSKKDNDEKHCEIVLHVEVDDLINFAEKVGFRYCVHKAQRLSAAVSYRRLRREVIRQHNFIVKRVEKITNYKQKKLDNPKCIIKLKTAISQAIKELQEKENLIHDYAIPTNHDIHDHLIKGTEFGKFRAKGFPTAEEYLKQIGALDWFLTEEDIAYGVTRECESLPTFNLKVIDRRPIGLQKVYDITVDDVHSFLGNGVVSHNCLISQGVAATSKDRLMEQSDKYYVYACNSCGLPAIHREKEGAIENECHICETGRHVKKFPLPYGSKLLLQEFTAMNMVCRMFADGVRGRLDPL